MILEDKKLREELLGLLKRLVIGFFLGYAIALLARDFHWTMTHGFFGMGRYSWRVVLGITILVAVYPYVWKILKGT